jgi:hypothetical protein
MSTKFRDRGAIFGLIKGVIANAKGVRLLGGSVLLIEFLAAGF